MIQVCSAVFKDETCFSVYMRSPNFKEYGSNDQLCRTGAKLEFGRGQRTNLGFVGHEVHIIEGGGVLFKLKRIKNYKYKIRSWALEGAHAKEGPWNLCFLSSTVNWPQIKDREKKVHRPKFKSYKFWSHFSYPHFVTERVIYSHWTSIFLSGKWCLWWNNKKEKGLKIIMKMTWPK